jgi:hypothetical protein
MTIKKLKIKALLTGLVSTFTANVWAENNTTNNTAFQKFENQYNLGYSFTQSTLINGDQETSSFNTQSINLEIERLFDVGVWFDVSSYTVTSYSQPNLGALNGGDGSGIAFGQDPFMFGINAKVGYAFQLINNTLQIIPYAGFGRNANLAASTVIANNHTPLTNDYFYTGILGARLAYRINNSIMLYANEEYNYNWDNSGAIKDIQTKDSLYGKSYAATNYTLTTTLGAKFNLTQNFQVGVNGFWNNFQPQSNISGKMYTPTNTFGEMVTVGLTY